MVYKFQPGNILRRCFYYNHDIFYLLIKVTAIDEDEDKQVIYRYDVLDDDDVEIRMRRPNEVTNIYHYKYEIEDNYSLVFNPNKF